MANFSEFQGEMSVFAKDIDTAVKIANILIDVEEKMENKALYGFRVVEDMERVSEDNVFYVEDRNNYHGLSFRCDVSVNGTGRWTFANNIEYFGNWTENNFAELGMEAERDFLMQEDFLVVFEGYDFEIGDKLLGEITGSTYHRAGSKFSDMEAVVDLKRLDFTVENVMYYMNWEQQEAEWSMFGCFKS